MVDHSLIIIPVVNSVLQQNKHILDGVTLSVTACNNTCGLPNKEEAQESRTIEVTRLAPATTKDSITMFFENTKRTGGGEVEHVDFMPDLGIAVVTFVKAESKYAHEGHTKNTSCLLRSPSRIPSYI